MKEKSGINITIDQPIYSNKVCHEKSNGAHYCCQGKLKEFKGKYYCWNHYSLARFEAGLVPNDTCG